MRDVGADLLVRLQELFDAVEQPVEGPRQRSQVVVYAAQRNAPAPVAVHQAMRGPPHRTDTAQELRAEPQSADRPERERRRDRPGEGGQHAGQDRVGTAELVADEERRSVGERGDERTDDLRPGFGRLFAIGFLRLDPSIRGGAGAREAQISGDRLAVGTHETVGETCAARSPRIDDPGEPVASALGERAFQRIRLLGDPFVEIGQDLMPDGEIDEGAQRQRRGGEQRQIERRQPEAGGPKQPDSGHATCILRRARSGSARGRRGRSCRAAG